LAAWHSRQAFSTKKAIILLYSVASQTSFQSVIPIYQIASHATAGDYFPTFMLVGNKCDTYTREVETEEGAELARQLGCAFWETSAKMNTNVSAAMTDLVRRVRSSQVSMPIGDVRKSGEKKRAYGGVLSWWIRRLRIFTPRT